LLLSEYSKTLVIMRLIRQVGDSVILCKANHKPVPFPKHNSRVCPCIKDTKMRIEKGFVRRLLIGIPVFICMAGVLWNPSASQAAFSTLHSFAGSTGDGARGKGDLTLSGSTLYGMTYAGGACNTCNEGCGTIFKMNADGNGYQVLHSFSYSDGASPQGSLTLSGATLYGMTSTGGAYCNGTIFRINTDGTKFQVLYNFYDEGGGYGSLTLSGSTLYGMTIWGGAGNGGTIFQINTDGNGFQVLHSFSESDGTAPQGSLTLSGSTLYGMTNCGGVYNYGTIFKINTDGNGFQVLHSFSGEANDGSYPYGSLTLSGATLYGMTDYGGVANVGTIFQINTDGTGFQVLHSFSQSDGTVPQGSLTLSGSTFYGTTYAGGAGSCGTILQINTDGVGFQVLYSFSYKHGIAAYGSLTLSGSTLYGMTYVGGAHGYGTIFSLTATPGAVVPGAPTIGTATAGNALAKVSFTAPASNGGSAITSYTVTSSPGGIKAKGHASPITVKGLTNGTAYTFTVTATNKMGAGDPSGPSNQVTPATVPHAPAIQPAVPDNASARVNFTLPANDGSPITLYTAKSYPGGITATGVGSPINVTGLTNGKTYTFTVRATNGIGDGPWSKHSNRVKPATIPGTPTIGTAKAGNAQATVYFKAPASNGGSRITSYTVTPSEGQAVSGTRSPITVKNLTNNKAYTFTVTATNVIGPGPASSASSPVTPVAP
jgi:uncharacterized repeat protein (TIGR03803 family)